MRELPEIARDRLAAGSGSTPHLDSNLISAFAERSLRADERQRVIAHLSMCAQCRAETQLVIGAAQPDPRGMTAATAEARPSRQGFSWQRLLFWQPVTAALAVAAITVSVFVFTRSRVSHPATPATVAIVNKHAPPSSPATAGNATVRLRAPAAASEAKQPARPAIVGPREEVVAAGHALAKQGKPKVEADAASAQLVSGNVTAPELDKAEARELVVAAPAPPPPQPASVPATASAAATQQSAAEGVSVPAGAAPRGVERAPAALSAAKFAAKSAMAPRRIMRAAGLAVRWAVTTDAVAAQVNQGAVERSLDGGRTWQRVPVAENVTFRAVFALANDVWAGGVAGAFYHSSDGGEHWSSIPLPATATTVGDIISIQFADALHGVVGTSTGATWTTSDGGRTWQQAPQN